MLTLPGVSEPPRHPPKFPDLVEGLFTSRGTHIIAGAQDCGKTAFLAWMLGEIQRTGSFLGQPAHLPAWVKVIVLDRAADDWDYWFGEAKVEVPEGYWLRSDMSVSEETIRSWDRGIEKRLKFFRDRVEELDPEPGGLLITDGGTALIGDGMKRYFESYANVLSLQRFAVDKHHLTHLLLCHAGKPKAKGARDAKARDVDKPNMSTGALGSLDTLSYLSTAQELVEDGEEVPPYQRFSWQPHHAKPGSILLGRTENGLFMPYVPPERASERGSRAQLKEERERAADIERVKLVKTLLEETEEKRLLGVQVARALQTRFQLSQSVAYRVIARSKEYGIARAEGRDLVLVVQEEESAEEERPLTN